MDNYVQTQTQSTSPTLPRSPRSPKVSQKFSSLRNIIRIPGRRTRGVVPSSTPNPFSPATANASLHSGVAPAFSPHHPHDNSADTMEEYGHHPYPRQTRHSAMKPYMSQPMLGLALSQTLDADGRRSLDMPGVYDNEAEEMSEASPSATPEHSPARMEPLHRPAGRPPSSLGQTQPQPHIQTHTQTQTQTRPTGRPRTSQGIVPTQNSNAMPKPEHTRKFSAHSISNALVNGTQAGFAIIGLRSRKSMDQLSGTKLRGGGGGGGGGHSSESSSHAPPPHTPSSPPSSFSLGRVTSRTPSETSTGTSKGSGFRSFLKRPRTPSRPGSSQSVNASSIGSAGGGSGGGGGGAQTLAETLFSRPRPENGRVGSEERVRAKSVSALSRPTLDGVAQEMGGSEKKPLPALPPGGPHKDVHKPTSASASASAMTEVSTMSAAGQPTPDTVGTPADSNSSSIPMPRVRARSRPLPPPTTSTAASNTELDSNSNTRQRRITTPGEVVSTVPSTSHTPPPPPTTPPKLSSPPPPTSTPPPIPSTPLVIPSTPLIIPSGALAPSSLRPSPLAPPKRSTTLGAPTPRLTLPPPPTHRFSLNALVEAGSARLSPSVIMRPPPLPLNLPVLMTPGGSSVGGQGGAGGQGRTAGLMRSMPALPLQGASRGTRGHEEVDDLEEEDEMEDEDEPEEEGEGDVRPTPRSSFSSERSLDVDMDMDTVEGDEEERQHGTANASRSSSYETARADALVREPSPTEPYFGNADKRFSRTPLLPRVDTSGFDLDFGSFLERRTPGTPREVPRAVDDKPKAKGKEREGVNLGLPVTQTPEQARGDRGVGIGASPGAAGNTRGGGGGEASGSSSVSGRTSTSAGAAIAPGVGASAISAGVHQGGVAGSGSGMEDYFYSPALAQAAAVAAGTPRIPPPLGPRRSTSRSVSERTLKTSMTSTTTTTTTTRAASPMRTPRPADVHLNFTTTKNAPPMPIPMPMPMPGFPSRVSEARLSVTMGSLSQHPGMYKMASRSLIDVHAIETKEKVEKMVRDQEEAVEETRKRKSMRRSNAAAAAKAGGEQEGKTKTEVVPQVPVKDLDPPHAPEVLLAGGPPASAAQGAAVTSEEEDEGRDRRISAAPAYDAHHLHPLRKRRSMPTFSTTTAPPPYPDFAPHPYGLAKGLVIQPREDEGKEKLPAYSNDVYLRAIMPRKMEFSKPGLQARDRKWRRVLCVLEGTAFKVYKVPAGATGVSAIGEWWESKVGVGDLAGDASTSTSGQATATPNNGFRITTVDTSVVGGASVVADPLVNDIERARARKSGEGGETGQPVLQRNSSVHGPPQPQPQPQIQPHQPSQHHQGHQSSHTLSTKSALSLAVHLLKPTRHARSNSDVGVSPTSAPRSPRASLNIPRTSSGRTTPTTSTQGSSSMRSHSPTASTHLTTPSSSAVFSHPSRPSTPASSTNGASPSSRSGFRNQANATSSSGSSQPSFPPSSFRNKGKERERDVVPEAEQAELIRAYTMQHAESGLGKDYLKRQHVIRVRLEGEQFLLQARDVEMVITWIEAFQSAANVALDLDERPMPSGPIFPRRRRRRRVAAPGVAGTTTTITLTTAASTGPLSSVRPLDRSAARRP